MAETLVKNKVCGECGSDVRPNSLFCYHCGGALDTESIDGEDNPQDNPSDVWFRSEIAKPEKKEDSETAEKDETEVTKEEREEEEVSETKSKEDGEKLTEVEADSKVEVEETKEDLEEDTEKEVVKEDKSVTATVKAKPFKQKEKSKKRKNSYKTTNSAISKGSELKSAAALRKREKPSRLKKVEIVWEERDESPNIWFVVFAIILFLLATALVVIAFYLK